MFVRFSANFMYYIGKALFPASRQILVEILLSVYNTFRRSCWESRGRWKKKKTKKCFKKTSVLNI